MSLFAALLLVATGLVLVAVPVIAPSPASAASAALGQGGQFVAASGTLYDTRVNGVVTTVAANTWISVPAEGKGTIPSTGVAAVQISLMALTPSTTGTLRVAADGSTSTWPALTYNAVTGTSQSLSNTAIVPVAADGAIRVEATTAVGVLIEVEGYYTSGAPGASGYVAVAPQRLVNTTSGLGAPKAQLADGSMLTVDVGAGNTDGDPNVPVGATAVYVNFTAVNRSATGAGYINAYAHDATNPGTGPTYTMLFPANTTTSLGQVVPLSADGKIDIGIHVQMDLLMDVLGYFAPNSAGGGASGGAAVAGGGQGAFTPAGVVVATSVSLAANASHTFQVAGTGGIPAAGTGITAVALNVQAKDNGTAAGFGQVYPDDKPSWAMIGPAYHAGLTASTFLTVGLGADGGITFTNQSTDAVSVSIDVEGWYTNLTDSVVVGNNGGTTPTQRSVALKALPETGAGMASTPVTYLYRNGVTGVFSAIPPGDLSAEADGSPLTGWPLAPSGSPAGFPVFDWDIRRSLGNSNVAALLQVEACYGTSSSDPNWICTMPNDIEYQPGSFGASAATTSIGPGVLSLVSGDYQVGGIDATISDSIGSISVGRSLTTLTPAQSSVTGGASTAQNVFGPGWNADLSGPAAGDGDLAAWDFRSRGYMEFTDPTGSAYFYVATGSITKYPITFTGVGDVAGDGSKVTLLDSTQTKTTMTEADGTVTTWTRASSSIPNWNLSTIVEPGSNTTTTYSYNAAGLVTRILAPVPAGVSCASPDATAGCRSLVLGYTTFTLNGASVTRLASVTASIPGAANPSVALETYGYNAAGYLTSATDARTGLVESYSYAASGNGATFAVRLLTVTAPGVNPWTLNYDANGRLVEVTQSVPVTNPATGTVTNQDATSTIVYDLPRGGVTGLPTLTGAVAAGWGQVTDLPVGGTAVFPPDYQPEVTTVAGMGTADWAYATLHYLDVDGREVDTATYSSAADATSPWLIDSTRYDANGNATWSLTAGNRAQALGDVPSSDSYVAAQSSPADRTNLLASTTMYNPLDPSEVTDTYGPTHPVTLASGTVIHARSHTATVYDEGAPNSDKNPATGAAYRLPTTVTTDPYNVVTNTDTSYPDASVTRAGYASVGSMGTLTGWSLGQATTSTVQMGASPSAADLTTTSVYDADGRTIATWLPGDTTGTTPRTRKTTYYGASAASPCGSALNAGLPCQTMPGGQPATGSLLPTTTTGYNQWGKPTTTSSAYGNSNKSSLDSYDPVNGRLLSVSMSTSAAPSDDTALPTVSYTYDLATGLPANTSAGTGAGTQSLSTTYNAVGAVGTYTDATGSKTTDGYDIDGRLIRRADGAGVTTWTYDGTPGEHRGLTTLEDIGLASVQADGGQKTFTATYDTAGRLAVQTYPGGITATHLYDNAGNQTRLTYKSAAGDVLMAFSQTIGTGGTGVDHVVAQSSTISGNPYSSQAFVDDPAGRLTTVQDTLNNSNTGSSTCETRVYGFDSHSNRLTQRMYPAGPGGACSTSAAPSMITDAFDAADRSISETYDVFGRVKTLGADWVGSGLGSHAAANGGPSGNVSLGYYSNDMVASQAQGAGATATSIAFTLDPNQNRINTEATTTGTGTDETTRTVTNHYDDSSDSPAWTSTTKADGTAKSTWLVEGLDGGLDATINASGVDATVTLSLANLHGDIVATCAPDATSIANYHETTEYGLPRNPATAADDYGWVGSHKRSTNDLAGLVLMGARLYNPTTGRFLSVDPIYRGNANTYTYPSDPINGYDLTGQCWSWCNAIGNAVGGFTQSHWKGMLAAGGVVGCTFMTGGACVLLTMGISAGINGYNYATHKSTARQALLGTATDFGFATAGYFTGGLAGIYAEKYGSHAMQYGLNAYTGIPGAAYTAGSSYASRRR